MTKHRNLKWTPMLLLFSGVVCHHWGVKYGQQAICALKGSSVVLPCSFSYPHGVRVLNVMWGQRDNIYTGPFNYDSTSSSASSRYEYVGDRNHNCSVKIHQVAHNDTGKHAFRFVADLTNGRVDVWTGKDGSWLKVVDLKIVVTRANVNGTVKEGDSVTLTCVNECESGRPSSVFTWFKNGQPTHQGAFLHFGNISSADSGNYSCSPQTEGRPISDAVRVQAEHRPKNASVSVLPSTDVDVGSNVTLSCSASANPTVEHYTWFKRGDGDVVVGNGPQLNFSGIRPNDGGQYLCRVVNKHGHQNSSVVTIKFKAFWPTVARDLLIAAAVALLTAIAIVAVRGLCKTKSRAPIPRAPMAVPDTGRVEDAPDTDHVQDSQNAVYSNWPVFAKSQPETEHRCEEVVYSMLEFNTMTKPNTQRQMDICKEDDSVVYSTVGRGCI